MYFSYFIMIPMIIFIIVFIQKEIINYFINYFQTILNFRFIQFNFQNLILINYFQTILNFRFIQFNFQNLILINYYFIRYLIRITIKYSINSIG
jgi:hypothetical protein